MSGDSKILSSDQQRLTTTEADIVDEQIDDETNVIPNGQFDVATLHILITDVNDHAPEFLAGSCYTLSVPENTETAIIHTLVAYDPDEGINGQIIYSIIGKNITFNSNTFPSLHREATLTLNHFYT